VVAAIWFATVYLGHHYVVHILAGVAYAIAAYAIVDVVLDRREEADVSRSRRPRGSPR
jgi:membrane-associated phospholipid phosphatase